MVRGARNHIGILIIIFISLAATPSWAQDERLVTMCGPMTLKAVCRVLGEDISLAEAMGLLQPREGETSLLNLKTAAEELGFHAMAYELSAKDLDKLECPAVLVLNRGEVRHSVTLVAVKEEKVYLIDPYWKSGWHWKAGILSKESWDGTALVVSRDAQRAAPFAGVRVWPPWSGVLAGVVSLAALAAVGMYLAHRRRKGGGSIVATALMLVMLLGGGARGASSGETAAEAGKQVEKDAPIKGPSAEMISKAGEKGVREMPVVFEDAEVYLGKGRTSSVLKGELVLVNEGTDSARLTDLRSTCGCMTADLGGKEVDAGGRLVIPVEMSSSRGGRVEATVYVVIAGYDTPLVGKVSGDFRRTVSFDPPRVVLGSSGWRPGSDRAAKRVLKVYSIYEEVEVSLRSVDERLDVSEIESEPDLSLPKGLRVVGTYEVGLSGEGLKAGYFRGKIEFDVTETPEDAKRAEGEGGESDTGGKSETDSGSFVAECWVNNFPVERVRAFPSSLAFAAAVSGSAPSKKVRIKSKGGTVEIDRVESPEGIEVSVTAREGESDEAELVVTLTKGAATGAGTLTVFMSGESEPLAIPVKVFE